MADLELIYIQMFPKEGDPGWHAGQLTDGRRVHAVAIPCNAGELHWSGSVEDATACECDGAGTCNLCLIRAEGGFVFTKVTGCYRSANSGTWGPAMNRYLRTFPEREVTNLDNWPGAQGHVK